MNRVAHIIFLISVVGAASSAHAGSQLGGNMPNNSLSNLTMIYSTDPALQCYNAARDGADLKFGLDHCNTAVIDPLMNYRAEIFVNRGIIRYDMGDHSGALDDFGNALRFNPAMGDAYLNQALVLVADNRPDEALTAINQGIALGATSLQVAYYTRGMIADDAGRYAQAYRDYRQALKIKPDYGPAERQLARFKVVPKGAEVQ